MQAVAAGFSGDAGKASLLFGEKSLKTVCFDSFILKKLAPATETVKTSVVNKYGTELHLG